MSDFIETYNYSVPSERLAPSAPSALAFQPEGERAFNGKASVFESIAFGAKGPTKFRPGAFVKSIETRRVKLLRDHDESKVIGTITSIVEGPGGLEISARVSKTPLGDETYQLLKDGALDALSIGFTPVKLGKPEQHPEHGTVRIIEEADLAEVSVVLWGADPLARVTSVHTADGGTRTAAEAWAVIRACEADYEATVNGATVINDQPPGAPMWNKEMFGKTNDEGRRHYELCRSIQDGARGREALGKVAVIEDRMRRMSPALNWRIGEGPVLCGGSSQPDAEEK
jgi:HK97 family phage prohead protease